MKRIICGTDFSTHAAQAADVAAALAVRHGATVTLLHAVAPREVESLKRSTVEAIRNERRAWLTAEANRLRAMGAPVFENLVLGTPHELIVNAARRQEADLIVVASLGEISPVRWLVGSVAMKTAQKATMPTLIVRDPARLISWANDERPINVMACYDFSPASDAALRWIDSLQASGPCDLTVTYVSWPPQDVWRLGISESTAKQDNGAEVQAALERELKQKCHQFIRGAATGVVVPSWGRADVHLNELAKTNDAEIVVLGTRHRNIVDRFWIGSVSRGVIRHSQRNVLCVPHTQEAQSRVATETAPLALVPIDFEETVEQPIAIHG